MANLKVEVNDGNNLTVQVTPVAKQTVQVSRGVAGAPGPNAIGGYPISLSGVPQNFDALMFNTGAWTNIPQTEIADGGNF